MRSSPLDLPARNAPVLLVPNIKFLQAGAGMADWPRVKVAMFAGDPGKQPRGAWQGFPAQDMLKAPHAHLNTYFSVGVQTGATRGLAGFEKIFAIVIDDVGVKADLGQAEKIMGLGPSYVIETSPGNFQAGWFTEINSRDWALGLMTALYGALGSDNLKNLVGYMRLPVGTNGKGAYGPGGFRHRLVSWDPGRRVQTLDWVAVEGRLVAAGGAVTPIAAGGLSPGKGVMPPDPGEIESDAVLQAFRVLGRVQGLGRSMTMGWGFDVDCPWIEDHGERAGEGASYVPLKGRFHCHHGHCQDRTMEDVRGKLDELLRRDQPGTTLAGLEFEELGGDQVVVDQLADADTKTAVGRGGRPLAAYEASEDGAVQAFADRYAGQLRFDHTRGVWFSWSSDHWRRDATQHVFRLICDLCREFRLAQIGLTPAQSRVIAKTSFALAVERACRAHSVFAVDGLSWDQDPWRVGAPGCEIDLTTGAIEPCDPDHLITRQVSVAPDFTMATPVWDQFLWDSTGGDVELIGFLQAWCGYCLTGDTSEERFVFIWGPGGNGKSTFIAAITAILGDYATVTEADLFMQQRYDAHPEAIARLAGVRAVFASEIADGRTFNATRLKNFTGRDRLTARFMRENSFTFMPQFKISFQGNNQPRLAETGTAIKRRVTMIPFVYTPGPGKADPTLRDRLVIEYPGILAGMIRGEQARRAAGGLANLIPATAAKATSAYLDDQDSLKTWASERCVFKAGVSVNVTAARDDYRAWCHQQGEALEISVKKFGQKFLEKFTDCTRDHTRSGSFLQGVGLIQQSV